MSDENCRPPMENLINYSALCQTPPSYSDSDPNILPGLESLVCSDNGQKSVLRINNELINNYFLMLSQTQQPQQPLASLNQLHVLQKIAPFVSTALTGFRAVPVRLKILFDKIFKELPEHFVGLLLAKANWSLADFCRGYVQQCPSKDPLMLTGCIETWPCIALHLELVLIQGIANSFTQYANLANSLKQMAIQSLLYTAALTSHTQQLLEKRLQDLTKNFYDTAGIVRNSSVATTFSSIDNQLLTIGPKKSESLTSESQQPQQQSDQDIWNDDSKTATNPSTDNESTTFTIELIQNCSTTNGGGTPTSLPSNYTEIPVKFERICENKATKKPSRKGATLHNVRKAVKNSKRRVQCQHCLKTYCDKGALKIHNSAVHMKEMHRCIVDGCDRVFSSRRSRNRHSGNVNMHMVHLLNNSGSSIKSTVDSVVEQVKNCFETNDSPVVECPQVHQAHSS